MCVCVCVYVYIYKCVSVVNLIPTFSECITIYTF